MPAAGARAAPRLRVLVVDDQETQLVFTRMLLGEERFEFAVASNGREAVEQAKAVKPDVILLDVQMPEMDGITAARRLRGDPDTAEIPIIMVTTRSEADDMERAYLGGCSDYVIKPVHKDELLAKIHAAVGR